jgi:hypothetical protein
MQTNETLAYVIADLRDRAEVGLKKYGHGVEDSPDDMLQHAYEEALDLAMYLKTEIRRKKREAEVNETIPYTVGDYT